MTSAFFIFDDGDFECYGSPTSAIRLNNFEFFLKLEGLEGKR